MRKFFIIILLLLLSILILILITNKRNTNIYKKINLNSIDNIMFVAHPDDESLWGGYQLIKDNYLVVCVTCGTNKTRLEEIKQALNITGDKLIYLGYPDKEGFKRSDWKKQHKSIEYDIQRILKLKKFKKIVTHNPSGEYGHNHHIMTSNIVTKYADKDRLYYFNIYRTKRYLKEHPTPQILTSEELALKKQVLEVYKSQGFIKKMFYHFIPYEEIIKYAEYNKISQ